MVRGRWRRGRARVEELVVWDVGLLVLVGLLWFADRQLAAREAEASDPPEVSQAAADADPAPRPAASRGPQRATPSPAPSRRPPIRRRVTDAPAEDREAQVAALAERAEERLAAGEPDAALAVFDEAPGELRGTRAWSDARDAVTRKLARADAVRALLPQVGLLADRGEAAAIEELLQALPSGADRDLLEPELTQARSRGRAAGEEGGFTIEGFRPGWQRVDRTRCALESALPAALAGDVATAADVVLSLAERHLGLEVEEKLVVTVLEADDPAPKDARAVWTCRRKEEPDAALIDRVRRAVAEVAARRLLGSADGAPGWLREGLIRALAGTEPAGVGAPRLTPVARAWRRLFLTDRPRGDGTGLGDLVRAGSRYDAVRAWAFVRFAVFGDDPAAAPLRERVLEAMGNARSGGDAAFPFHGLGAAEAASAEPAWIAAIEEAP